jgi:hypothetical protein
MDERVAEFAAVPGPARVARAGTAEPVVGSGGSALTSVVQDDRRFRVLAEPGPRFGRDGRPWTLGPA